MFIEGNGVFYALLVLLVILVGTVPALWLFDYVVECVKKCFHC